MLPDLHYAKYYHTFNFIVLMELGNFKNQGLVDFVEVHYINQNNLKNNINTIQCMLNLDDCV